MILLNFFSSIHLLIFMQAAIPLIFITNADHIKFFIFGSHSQAGFEFSFLFVFFGFVLNTYIFNRILSVERAQNETMNVGGKLTSLVAIAFVSFQMGLRGANDGYCEFIGYFLGILLVFLAPFFIVCLDHKEIETNDGQRVALYIASDIISSSLVLSLLVLVVMSFYVVLINTVLLIDNVYWIVHPGITSVSVLFVPFIFSSAFFHTMQLKQNVHTRGLFVIFILLLVLIVLFAPLIMSPCREGRGLDCLGFLLQIDQDSLIYSIFGLVYIFLILCGCAVVAHYINRTVFIIPVVGVFLGIAAGLLMFYYRRVRLGRSLDDIEFAFIHASAYVLTFSVVMYFIYRRRSRLLSN